MSLKKIFAPLALTAVFAAGCSHIQPGLPPGPATQHNVPIPECDVLYDMRDLGNCVTAVRENLRLHAQRQVAPLVTEHIGTERFDFADFIRDMVAVSDSGTCQIAYSRETSLRRLLNNADSERPIQVDFNASALAHEYLENLSECTLNRAYTMYGHEPLQDAAVDLWNLGGAIENMAVKLENR